MKLLTRDRLALMSDAEQEYLYCGMDSMVTYSLHNIFRGENASAETYEHARRQIGPYSRMSYRGIRIDLEEVGRQIPLLDRRAGTLTALWEGITGAVCGNALNPRSGPQLNRFFYDELAIPKIFRARKGKSTLSCDRKALEKIRRSHLRGALAASIILKIRDIEKVKEVLTKELRDGRWHASYNIAGTNTGRRSSSSDHLGYGGNAQNLDKDLRICFVPDPGYVLVQIDQQGAESRGVAYLSGDPGYIRGVEEGDVHSLVAAMVFGRKPTRGDTEVVFYRGKTYRDIAKMCGHASNYLAQARTIAIQGNIEIALAEEFQQKYFKAFPGIRAWQLAKIAEVQRNGYLTTPWGLARRFWDRLWDDATLREAIAFEPQSLVGGLTARAAIELDMRGVQLLADIHDALLFQVPTLAVLPSLAEAATIPVLVRDIKGVERKLVIPWDVKVGGNWGESSLVKNPGGLVKWVPELSPSL